MACEPLTAIVARLDGRGTPFLQSRVGTTRRGSFVSHFQPVGVGRLRVADADLLRITSNPTPADAAESDLSRAAHTCAPPASAQDVDPDFLQALTAVEAWLVLRAAFVARL